MKQSEAITISMQEAQTRMSSIDNELESLNQALTLKAANGEAYDAKSVLALEKNLALLQQEKKFSMLKLAALEAQLTEAKRADAQERIDEISSELKKICTEAEHSAQISNNLITELAELVRIAAERRHLAAELQDEMHYLALAYDLKSPSMPELQMPDKESAETFARSVCDALSRSTVNPWSYKLTELRQQRSEEAAKQQDEC